MEFLAGSIHQTQYFGKDKIQCTRLIFENFKGKWIFTKEKSMDTQMQCYLTFEEAASVYPIMISLTCMDLRNSSECKTLFLYCLFLCLCLCLCILARICQIILNAIACNWIVFCVCVCVFVSCSCLPHHFLTGICQIVLNAGCCICFLVVNVFVFVFVFVFVIVFCFCLPHHFLAGICQIVLNVGCCICYSPLTL